MRVAFIGGLQRSGTTVLGRVLSSHPDVTGLVGTPTAEDEGQFVQDVYLDDHAMGRGRFRERGKSMHWAFHPQAHLTDVDAAAVPDGGRRLLDAWLPYAERPDAQILLEKSPSNLTRTLFLQSLLPDAQFVVITRHPVMQALAIRKWGTVPARAGLRFEAVIEHWLTAMEHFLADAPRLQHVTCVSFEGLVAQPDATFDHLMSFLGLDPAPLEQPSFEAGNQRYAEYWAWFTRRSSVRPEPINPVYNAKSHALRSSEDLVARLVGARTARRAQDRFGDRLAAFGYSLDDLHHRAPSVLDDLGKDRT